MTLQRLVIEMKPGELVIRVLYRSQDGPGPNTKARQREVTELARSGLTQAVEAFDGGVEVFRTSGCEMREDNISTDAGKGD
jgi:hypothetical protein